MATTAFQSDSFQNDAFQTGILEVTSTGSPSFARRFFTNHVSGIDRSDDHLVTHDTVAGSHSADATRDGAISTTRAFIRRSGGGAKNTS